MTSAGIVVPDEVIRGIMVAVSSMQDDGLNADVEASFYAANVRLVRLRRGLHYDDEGEIEKPFDAALADADLLLKFASERGLDIPREAVQPILATRSAVAAGNLTDTIQADFYSAYGRLCKQFGEVTADTIRACRSEATKRTLRYNRIIALNLTTLIAISSVIVFVTDSLSDNLQKNVAIANESAAKLRATLTQDDISAALGSDTKSTDQCGLLTEPPPEHRRNIMTAAEIEPLQHFAATVRDIRSQAIKLNVVVGGIECDPFASCGASRTAFCTSACYDDCSIPVVYRFELNPAIRNYTAEVLCKIKT